MKNVGLVLEGGAMRGVYTSGVLDFLMDNNFNTSYVIGVSAGSCNGAFYVAKQRGGAKKSTIDVLDEVHYVSYRNLFRNGSLLCMDLIFDKFPNEIVHFDYESFYNSHQKFVIVATNCETGNPIYYDKNSNHNIWQLCRASSSLPLICPIVNIDNNKLLDGGLTDAIPIRKAIEDGNERNILILTRPKGYRKKPSKSKLLIHRKYAEYPDLQNAIFNRYKMYNDTLDYIEKLEEEGKVFVIRPSKIIAVGRMEQHKDKLLNLYNLGYEDCKNKFEELLKWYNK